MPPLTRETQSRTSAIGFAKDFVDVTGRRFASLIGYDKARQIVAYRSYASGDRVWVQGRLLANKTYGGPKSDDNWWDNLKASYVRWQTHEIPGAEIQLIYGDAKQSVVTNDEGYYAASFVAKNPSPSGEVVEAVYSSDAVQLKATHEVMVVHPRAKFMIVSDVDDTLIHTYNTDLMRAAKLTFLKNARTRKPLAGASYLYRALCQHVGAGAAGAENPIIYLSNSGWNLYDLLRDFMDLNDFPFGPILLRDLGLGAKTSDHKINTLIKLMDRIGSLPVILIGDSGQHDAQIYAKVARKFPDRVKAIFIRDVDPNASSKHDKKIDGVIEDLQLPGVAFHKVKDSAELAHHAARLGFLSEKDVAEIVAATEVDRARREL